MHIAFKLLFIVLVGSIVFAQCGLEEEKSSSGRLLAEKHCGSCHLPVSPKMLDSVTWIDQVLPVMAPKLGIHVWSQTAYFVKENEQTSLSLSDWNKIVSYFKENAPKQLTSPAISTSSVLRDWSIFELRKPSTTVQQAARTSMVSFNKNEHTFYTGNAYNELGKWNNQLQQVGSIRLPSPPVHISYADTQLNKENAVLTCIGTIDANDEALGSVMKIHPDGSSNASDTLFSSLPRPVQSVPVDVNNDGLIDWIVCAFGHNNGGLFMFIQTPAGGFEKKIIQQEAGALQAVTGDFNNDGWTDIMVLFAHANERIVLFQNDHHGGFTDKLLLQFPAVQGSTSFQLTDFNSDGKPDILYTAGDNADYSKVLKPYHGVYIFINKENFVFEQAYFYPLHGCFKAMAGDFDKDGDNDIAAIAFFTDTSKNGSPGCMYFEQNSYLQFTPYAIPVDEYGRWACMDVGDYDQDGDPDILLGNHSNGAAYRPGVQIKTYETMPFVILENITNR